MHQSKFLQEYCILAKLNDVGQCLLLNNERLLGTITEYKKELQVNSEQKENKLGKIEKIFQRCFFGF
jgi:hypothetical protein